MKRHFVIEIEVGETEEGWLAADGIVREIEDDVMSSWNGLVRIIHPTMHETRMNPRYELVGWEARDRHQRKDSK